MAYQLHDLPETPSHNYLRAFVWWCILALSVAFWVGVFIMLT